MRKMSTSVRRTDLYSAVLFKRFRDFILGGSVFPVAISRFAVCRAARRILVESSKFADWRVPDGWRRAVLRWQRQRRCSGAPQRKELIGGRRPAS